MIEDNKQKIPCGGFYIGEGLELDDATKTLKSVGGGGGGLSLVSGEGINITWDGSTEGRDVISFEAIGINLYKVSNSVLDNSELIGSVFGYMAFGQSGTTTLDESAITEIGTNCYGVNGLFVISGVAGEYSTEDEGETVNFTIPSDGTYFIYWRTPSGDAMAISITKTGTAKLMQNGEDVTQEVAETVNTFFDSPIMFVTIAGYEDNYTADKTGVEIVEAYSANKIIICRFTNEWGSVVQLPLEYANGEYARFSRNVCKRSADTISEITAYNIGVLADGTAEVEYLKKSFS